VGGCRVLEGTQWGTRRVGWGGGWAGLGWAGLRLGWEVSGQAGRQRAGGRAVTVAMADLPMLMAVVIAMPAAMVTLMATMPMLVLVNLL
jgi:hypothetical protein